MCLTCGCMLPNDDHGNPDYLTIEDLENSAKGDNMSLDEAVSNLAKTVEIAAGDGASTPLASSGSPSAWPMVL